MFLIMKFQLFNRMAELSVVVITSGLWCLSDNLSLRSETYKFFHKEFVDRHLNVEKDISACVMILILICRSYVWKIIPTLPFYHGHNIFYDNISFTVFHFIIALLDLVWLWKSSNQKIQVVTGALISFMNFIEICFFGAQNLAASVATDVTFTAINDIYYYYLLQFIIFIIFFIIFGYVIYSVSSNRPLKKVNNHSYLHTIVDYVPGETIKTNTECVICLLAYESNDKICIIQCKHHHHAHADCIGKWWTAQNKQSCIFGFCNGSM